MRPHIFSLAANARVRQRLKPGAFASFGRDVTSCRASLKCTQPLTRGTIWPIFQTNRAQYNSKTRARIITFLVNRSAELPTFFSTTVDGYRTLSMYALPLNARNLKRKWTNCRLITTNCPPGLNASFTEESLVACRPEKSLSGKPLQRPKG